MHARLPRHSTSRLLVLAAVVLGIAALTLSPGGARVAAMDTLWQRLSCIKCSDTWLADAIANVVLFVPLGVSLASVGGTRSRSLLAGVLLSLLIETVQASAFVAGRTPSLVDLITNGAGAWLGGTLAGAWPMLRAPTRLQARNLMLLWSACAVSVWTLLAYALRPAMSADHATPVSRSPLPFTPGYGYFQGTVTSAVVQGTPLAPSGTGPLIVGMARRDTVTARIDVVGRDRRRDIVPMLFVHDPSMRDTTVRATKAHLLLAQRGEDAWMSSDLNAGRWGLAVPALVARDVFAATRARVTLQASVTGYRWALSWRDHAAPTERHETSLTLSPLLGWALVQMLVPVSSPLAPVVTVAWVLCWLLPLAYWATRWSRKD